MSLSVPSQCYTASVFISGNIKFMNYVDIQKKDWTPDCIKEAGDKK